MIAGLENVSSGRILIGGEDVTGRPSAKRDLAMVFQSYALFPHLNVGENIIFGLKVRRVAGPSGTGVLHGLPICWAWPVAGAQAGSAFGRSAAACRAWAGNHRRKAICLMDEPLSNLDAKLRHEMRVEIRALQQQLGFTMVYVTHDQVEAITMADQVVLLNGGRLEQVASPRDLYEKPATPFAARFIGTPPMNLFPANAFRKLCTAPDFKLGLRPEAMHLEDGGPVNASVRAVEYLGADVLADCEVAGTGFQVRLPASRAFTPGQSVQLAFRRMIFMFSTPIPAAAGTISFPSSEPCCAPDLLRTPA